MLKYIKQLLTKKPPQYTIRNGRGRFGIPGSDRKPLVLSTYQDAQQHLPYADDSNAVTPMSEENGAIIVPVYYCNLGKTVILLYLFSMFITVFSKQVLGIHHTPRINHESRTHHMVIYWAEWRP